MIVNDYFAPRDNEQADYFLLNGFRNSGQKELLLDRLSGLNDINLLMEYDGSLIHSHPAELALLYAKNITALKESAQDFFLLNTGFSLVIFVQ